MPKSGRGVATPLNLEATNVIRSASQGTNIPVFVIEEDLAAQGIERRELVPQIELISSKLLPRRMAEYEFVLHW